MNILVYSGPETVQTSLSHTLSVLRSLALPNYTVQAITNQSLVNHPWTTSCALLVLPGCRNWYSPSTVAPIRSYVEGGGSLLAFGAGLRSSRGLNSSFATFSHGQEIPSLKFQDRKSGTTYYPVFQSDDAPKEVAVQHKESEIIQIIRASQDRLKIEVDDAPSAEVLARYEGEEEVAAVSCDVGQGKVVIWSPSLEYPTASSEEKRWNVLHHSLTLLRLQLPDSSQRTFSSRPLPLFLTGSPSIPGIVAEVVRALSPPPPPTDLRVFADANDKFHFHDVSETEEVLRHSHTRFKDEADPNLWQPKDIIVYRDGQLPAPDQTPLFDISKYYEHLAEAKSLFGLENDKDKAWGIGDAFMYSEIVTSTQTMLDKNAKLLSLLPTPFVCLGSHQLAGRGRGSNVWLSPAGCLQFSILLRVNSSVIPTQKLVFVQYLFGLAVVEACRDPGVLGEWGEQVRLKWPNDVYALFGPNKEKRKIGGILMNMSYTGSQTDVVIGSGTNVLNPLPIPSLAQLIPPGVEQHHNPLSMERTAAIIMAKFEGLWTTFVEHGGSFEPFTDLYLERWLHSDQLVTLTTVTPPKKVRIVGITSDHGLLRTVPERTGWNPEGDDGFIDLQPDGNSFDIMAGLIKTKTA